MSASKKPSVKIPLSLRLKAWWEGYDAEELAQLKLKNAPSASEARTAAKEPVVPIITPLQGETTGETSGKPERELPVDPWDENRIDVAQLIWGRGFCGPGGPEHVVAISKLLTLTPEMSMMHLGAGLGGPARTLAEAFGVWVTGYETSTSLVAAGSELSAMAGMAKKAPLAYLDLSSPQPFDRKYDRVMIDSFLSLVEDKEELMARVEESLKADGFCLITDYFLANNQSSGQPTFQEWAAGEPRNLTLVRVEELRDILQRCGYHVRVDDNLSSEYVSLIDQTWAGADKIVAELMAQPGQSQLVNVVFKEAELWARRAKLLRDGHITYRRILAAKRTV